MNFRHYGCLLNIIFYKYFFSSEICSLLHRIKQIGIIWTMLSNWVWIWWLLWSRWTLLIQKPLQILMVNLSANYWNRFSARKNWTNAQRPRHYEVLIVQNWNWPKVKVHSKYIWIYHIRLAPNMSIIGFNIYEYFYYSYLWTKGWKRQKKIWCVSKPCISNRQKVIITNKYFANLFLSQ